MANAAGIARAVCEGVSRLTASGATITAGRAVYKVDVSLDPKHVILFQRTEASAATRALIAKELVDGRYVWAEVTKVRKSKGDEAVAQALRASLGV
ncbi:hypothetical protein BIV57_11855 [Mangrovactinospora gilvigrisea]|uniref:Uncharacterized protein n=2 Tax=Mangrovactinospora gilvigrisea TaxID=1428644 RepID=A0A1J7BEZ0_9ACTN|nr:hypothetical protein BIV57_11855 [Mangrovactinospora gilvigrisea]